MNRRKKKGISTFGVMIMSISLLCVGAGVVMAVNSCTHGDEPSNPNAASGGQMVDPSTNRPEHYPGLETLSIPDDIESQLKEYVGFTISFNKINKTPNYVIWELLGEETNGDQERSDKFWTDPDLEGCPSTKDYTRSGYDRGHLCPAADQKWNAQAMADCFVMANIAPQKHELNAGAWLTLENKERQWAQRDSAIMIVAGPLYSDADKTTIGDAKVRVPGAFFKALVAPYVESPRGIAFIYPNMSAPGNMQDYAVSIDELEKITGFDFFPALPDDIENIVESTFSFKEWNSSK